MEYKIVIITRGGGHRDILVLTSQLVVGMSAVK